LISVPHVPHRRTISGPLQISTMGETLPRIRPCGAPIFVIEFATMSDGQSSAQIVSYRDTKGRFIKGWKGGGRKLGSRHKIAEDFLTDFHTVWQEHGLQALRETALSEPAKFCAIAAHLIRNEQTDLRSASDFRDYQSAEEVLAKIRDEFGPEAAAALRRFSRAIERQGPDSRFDRNDGHVIDIGPDRVDDKS
jgi:hypothetical protein